MRRKNWLIALLALVSGIVIWRLFGDRAFIISADRTFQDGVVEAAKIPGHPPVAVTLVNMEDAGSWTALEYSLFLKALPKENPPIVIFESMPGGGKTAFDRSFTNLAIRQPRLVLPVQLAWGGQDNEEATWWLKGWEADPAEKSVSVYGSIVDEMPEVLRGTVAVGIANPPAKTSLAPLYFVVGKKNVPSLAMRGAMLVRRVSDESIRLDHGLILGDQRLPVNRDGTLPVDVSLIPGMRRIASSDLLLNLSQVEMGTASRSKVDPRDLQGVLVLGDVSPEARSLPLPNGMAIAPAEYIAATVATICNGPVLAPANAWIHLLFLVFAAFAPLIFVVFRRVRTWFGFTLLLMICATADYYLAARFALAGPFLLPVSILLLGTIVHDFALRPPRKKDEPEPE